MGSRGDGAGTATVPLAEVSGARQAVGQGLGDRRAPPEQGTRVASWQPWRPAGRQGHPDAFSPRVTRPGGARTRGGTAQQVSPPGCPAGAHAGRGRRTSQAPGADARAPCCPHSATPRVSQGSSSPRRVGAARILARALVGTLRVAQSGLPAGPWIPGGEGWGPGPGPFADRRAIALLWSPSSSVSSRGCSGSWCAPSAEPGASWPAEQQSPAWVGLEEARVILRIWGLPFLCLGGRV